MAEVTKNAFGAGMAQVTKKLQFASPDLSKSFTGRKVLIVLGEEEKDQRNKVLIPTMVDNFKNTLCKIEKVFKMLNLPSDRLYLFGDMISLADLQCVAYRIFFNDAEFNKFGQMKGLLELYAPRFELRQDDYSNLIKCEIFFGEVFKSLFLRKF